MYTPAPNTLRIYRRMSGLFQKDVARILGYTDTAPISRWEKGRGIPSMLMLFRLSKLYGAFPHELFPQEWEEAGKGIEGMQRKGEE